MSSPTGDLPDWETLVTPLVQPAAQLASGATSGIVIASFPAPFRIWGVWISFSLVTTPAYAGGTIQLTASIQDGAGNPIIALELAITGPGQVCFDSAGIGVAGLTPAVHTGNYEVLLVVGAPAPNSFVRASAGIYYSSP